MSSRPSFILVVVLIIINYLGLFVLRNALCHFESIWSIDRYYIFFSNQTFHILFYQHIFPAWFLFWSHNKITFRVGLLLKEILLYIWKNERKKKTVDVTSSSRLNRIERSLVYLTVAVVVSPIRMILVHREHRWLLLNK